MSLRRDEKVKSGLVICIKKKEAGRRCWDLLDVNEILTVHTLAVESNQHTSAYPEGADMKAVSSSL